jgi:hypothetical protein
MWGGGGGGTNRSDEPGPGEYDADKSSAWGCVGKSGPSFTFGGRKDDGKGKRTAAARDVSSSSSSFSVPGPGSYYRDDDDDDGGGDKAGGRATRGFSFGGRTGKAWDTAGPGGAVVQDECSLPTASKAPDCNHCRCVHVFCDFWDFPLVEGSNTTLHQPITCL